MREIHLKDKIITSIVVLTSLLYMIGMATYIMFSRDLCFMIAPGREILKGTFVKENIWLIGEGYNMPVQAWLSCVVLALADMGGDVFSWLILAIQAFLLFSLLYSLFRMKKIDRQASISISSILTAMTPLISSLRPETITTILLLVEVIALEKYRETKKVKYLCVLPLTTLLEINFHASMWLPHFLILIAYMVPSILPSKIKDTSLFKNHKQVIITTIFMVGSLFVNPYGIDNILYSFNGVFNKESKLAEGCSEMRPISILSIQTFFIILGIVIILYLIKKQKLNSVNFYLFAGFSFMMIIISRSEPLFFIALYMLIRDFVVCTPINNNKTQILKIGFCICFTVIFSINMFYIQHYKNLSQSYNVIDECLTEAGINKEDNIFCGPAIGSILEYYDYRNIYCDYRVELLTKSVNKKDDILREIVDYCFNGYKNKNGEKIKITDTQYYELIDKYNFKYFVVIDEDKGFSSFIERNEAFEKIASTEVKKDNIGKINIYIKK